MREFNLLENYPNPKNPRLVNSKLRTIENRILASYRDINLYDGDRNNGYGGFVYDGRWVKIAKKICEEYILNSNSSFLHIGCEKGFLMHDMHGLYPKMKIVGLETSQYAINKSMPSIKKNIIHSGYINLNMFKDNSDYLSILIKNNQFTLKIINNFSSNFNGVFRNYDININF